jgi:uncharacterized protein (DUF433 family)
MVTTLQAATEGLGVYSVAEAARYARMPSSTLKRWFFGNHHSAPMSRSGITDEGIKRISFTDFVEALAIRSLRADYGVSLQKIKESIRNAKERYGIDHPFARQDHRTVLVGKDLHIFLKEDAENPVGLTGRDLGQKSMKPCIEAYMKDLDYDADGLAVLYRAFTFGDQEIVLNPKIRFGAPCVAGFGYSAETLWRAAVAEGSIERAADLYEVPVPAVEAAYRYWNQGSDHAA